MLFPYTPDQFLDFVRKSGLVDHATIEQVCNEFDGTMELDQLCNRFIARGLLTVWQCNKLQQGKYKGFYLDNYCILKLLEIAENNSSFIARDTTSGERVLLIINPLTLIPLKDGKLQYEVRPIPGSTD
jgi:serine/threonine-protein kinase